MDLLWQSDRSQKRPSNAIQLKLAQTTGLDAGILPLLCVCVAGLTYSIVINQVTLPSRGGFQQVSCPHDWNYEFNKKQQSKIKEGTQSVSGDSKSTAEDGKDLGSRGS